MANVHPQSQEGYALGKSELYDKFRPQYDVKVLSYIREAVGLGDDLQVVEIGCGSGLFTRAMLENWSSSLKEIKCFDPNDGMLKVFRETVHDTRVTVSEGTFDATGVEVGWADLIVVATAFHWCLNIEGAVKEFVRILKPTGTICFLWNGEDRDVTWVREVFEYVISVPTNKPAHDFRAWEKMFDLATYKENFYPPQSQAVKYMTLGTLKSHIDRVMTWSALAALNVDGKRVAREKIKEIIHKGDGLVWVNKEEGVFEVPYSVPVVYMKRKEAAF